MHHSTLNVITSSLMVSVLMITVSISILILPLLSWSCISRSRQCKTPDDRRDASFNTQCHYQFVDGLGLDDHCLNLGLDLALTVLVLYLEIKTVQDTWRPTRCIIQHSMSLPVRWCATILSFNSLTFGHVCVFAVSYRDIFHCFGLGTYTVLPSLIVHALYLTFMFASVAVTIST